MAHSLLSAIRKLLSLLPSMIRLSHVSLRSRFALGMSRVTMIELNRHTETFLADFLLMMGGIGCFISSAITLLVRLILILQTRRTR